MTITERQDLISRLFDECREVLLTKGADYAGNKDSLANFKRNADKLGLSKYQIWGVYCAKHLDAIFNSIKANPLSPQVESEPLHGRILDAINYLGILDALIAEDQAAPMARGSNPVHGVGMFEGGTFKTGQEPNGRA